MTECSICSRPGPCQQRHGAVTCRSCQVFFSRHQNDDRLVKVCKQGGGCSLTHTSRMCAPCRLTRCLAAGMHANDESQRAFDDNRTPTCTTCGTNNRSKRAIECAVCHLVFHLTCVGITRAQAAELSVWHCQTCLDSTMLADAVNDSTDETPPPTDLAAALASLHSEVRVTQHVPKGKRHRVALDLSSLITTALESRSVAAWWRLLSYAYTGPLSRSSTTDNHQRTRRTPATDDNAALGRRVRSKCADGDIKGSLRLLSSEDTVAPPSEEVLVALQSKHPPAPTDEDLGDYELATTELSATESDVEAALLSFSPSSSAGLDGIRPMHLRQLTNRRVAEAGRRLLTALTALVNSAISGSIPDRVRETFFSARLVALKKKDGGLRPIAIGSTYRRLASKIVARNMAAAVAPQLRPVQLGVGTPLGCEAAVHAVRDFAERCSGVPGNIICKLDLQNAFNSVHRRAVFDAVSRRYPAALPLLRQAYARPSPLFVATSRLWSCRGVQQGDPLGPLLFALAVDPVAQSLQSPMNVWFLDDATLAGPASTVARDIERATSALSDIGLTVNESKCEVTRMDQPTIDSTTNSDITTSATTPPAGSFFSSASPTPLDQLKLLGAPIRPGGIGSALEAISNITRLMTDRSAYIGGHAALFFLSRYTSVPRATYLLRSAPVHQATAELQQIDDIMRDALSRCCNVELDDDAWTQASLPIRLGGIGMRRLVDVALPAHVASLRATEDLVRLINSRLPGDRPAVLESAVATFKERQCPDLDPDASLSQSHLDEMASKKRYDSLLTKTSQIGRARLLAAAAPHSGAWLSALPVQSLGLLLPDEAVRVGVALRLGVPVMQPHRCRCGAMADRLGHHSLSCHSDPGRLPRHTALNDAVYRSLSAAGVTAILEPRGLDRGDGRRPDGLTIAPFRRGRMLLWDATCTNTFGVTHLLECAVSASAAARSAEERKRHRYAALCQSYDFAPLAVETTGVLGPTFETLIAELGRRISERTGERRETQWLRQRVALAVVRGNAAAVCR